MIATQPKPLLFADHSLGVRLERAEAFGNLRFVEARARLMPESGAQWIGVAGAYAMYDGPRSPCTQTFGLGMSRLPTAQEMGELERFFKDRQATVFHEVSPLADKALISILSERGYKTVELSNVMFMPLTERNATAAALNRQVSVRAIKPGEQDLWAQTATAGWREFPEIADLMLDLMRVSAEREGGLCFLAELDGQPIATAGLALHEGVALFAGASTIPQWRRQGAQQLLFESRCRSAIDAGCDLAMVCTEPGSSSQRNAERQGFRVAYTRTKWGLFGSDLPDA